MFDPPGAIARNRLGTQELEFGAGKTAVEHVAPSARKKAVGFALASELLVRSHIQLPWLHLLLGNLVIVGVLVAVA